MNEEEIKAEKLNHLCRSVKSVIKTNLLTHYDFAATLTDDIAEDYHKRAERNCHRRIGRGRN